MKLHRLKVSVGILALVSTQALADQVILDDLIVDGSICVGLDCVNGESFGFDTIRLKENNLRIKFQDTSSSAGFATNDWQITINDTSNGGLNKFSIDDIDGGKTPLTLEAGAPSHSLYLDDSGRLGLGTNAPVANVHVKTGNTPTLRLEQDGSSGFTPQTWDVAGNETNFFVRDATNGSTLPFRIRPGAPSSAMDISGDGDVGVGTSSPTEALHIKRVGTGARLLVETTTSGNPSLEFRRDVGSWIAQVGAGGRLKIGRETGVNPLKVEFGTSNDLLRLGAAGSTAQADAVTVKGQLGLQHPDPGQTTRWDLKVNPSNSALFVSNGTAPTPTSPIKISQDASNGLLKLGFGAADVVEIKGELRVDGLCLDGVPQGVGACADYVFEPDYQLRTFDELEAFLDANGHLPNVPSAAQIKQEGLSLASFTGRLLEKIEELTLYTLQQQDTIEQQQASLGELSVKIEQLSSHSEAL